MFGVMPRKSTAAEIYFAYYSSQLETDCVQSSLVNFQSMHHITSLDTTRSDGVTQLSTHQNGRTSDEASHQSENHVILSLEPQSRLEKSIRSINSELIILGYQSIISVEEGKLKMTLNGLVDGINRMLQTHLKNLNVYEDLQCRNHSLEGDLAHERKMHRRCQQDLEESLRANAAGKERERRQEAEQKKFHTRLKASNDEVRKLQANFQRHETQTNHERRKMEREMSSLRERLTSSFSTRPPTGSTSPTHRALRNSNRRSVTLSGVSLSSSAQSLTTLIEHTQSMEMDSRSGGTAHTRPGSRVRQVSRVAARSLHSTSAAINANSQNLMGLPNAKSDNGAAVMGSWTLRDTAEAASSGNPSQTDLYHRVVQQLEERQHSLLYENRELRDLISQLASRLFRFTGYIRRQHNCDQASRELTKTTALNSKNNGLSPSVADGVEGEFDSLDETDDDAVCEAGDIKRGDSSTEDLHAIVPRLSGVKHGNDWRRKSANVNQLLLELPYTLVRENLTQRLRHLSRDLWRTLKGIHPSHRNTMDGKSRGQPCGTDTSSSTHIAPPNERTEATTKDHDNVQLQSEVVELRNLVCDYEARIREHEVGLRHALFANSRRQTAISQHNLSGVLTPTTPLNHSSERIDLAPQRVSPHGSDRSRSDSREGALTNGLPRSGAGDEYTSTPRCTIGRSSPSLNNETNNTAESPKIMDPDNEIPVNQKPLNRKVSDSDISSESPHLEPAASRFTSSPFPARVRTLIVDEAQ